MYKKIIKENKRFLRNTLREISSHMKSGRLVYFDNMRVCYIKPKKGLLIHVSPTENETIRIKPDYIELTDHQFAEDLNSRLEFYI